MKYEIISVESSAMHTNTLVHITVIENNLFKLLPTPNNTVR